jgi:hypothetical protein
MEDVSMKSNLLKLGALSLGLACASHASANWTDVTDASELRALHSNTTLKGLSTGGDAYYAHFYDGGAGVIVQKGAQLPGAWQLNGNHEVCVKGLADAECYRFQKTGEFESLYRAIRVRDGMTIPLSVEKGVPEF